jgi:DNA invertase Pin-like site-specific DNA recombinase/tetrahydromethanopterin S-methyltransferase subunit G
MESQKNDLMPVIKTLGFNIPDKYIFGQKITGKDDVRKEERQSLKDLKKACESGEVKAVFISEVSRLSRDSISGRLYLRDFIEMKVPLYFKDISMWTLNPDTLEVHTYNNQFIGQLFDQAERELESIKKRTSRGRKQNAREGKVTGSYMKFGYKKDVATKKYLIDKTESDFIQDIYNKYISGEYSIRALTNYANTTGVKTRVHKDSKKETYKTKGGIIKKTSSTVWTTQTIRDILVNKIYLGERTFTDITYNIPPIVTEEQYNKVQDRLKLNVHYVSKAKKHTHLLQHLLICGNCGSFYYGQYKERSNSYLCSAYTRAVINCNNTSLNYERAEGIIWDFILNQTYFFKSIKVEEKNRLIDEQTEKRNDLSKTKNNFIKLLEAEKTKVQNLVNAVKEGIFTLDDIREQKKDVDSLIKNYESEISKINTELERIEKRIEYINSQNLTKSALKHIESNRGLMQEKIKEILDKIVVYKLDDYIALLQVHYLERVYNIIYNYRIQKNRYYFVENDIATFNNPHYQPEEVKEVLKGKVPEFTVTSSNNNTFNETVFGGYSGKKLIAIMDKQGLYRDYERPEKIIPEKIRK